MSISKMAPKFFAFLLLCSMLSSCRAGDDTMWLDMVGYNHTDTDIGSFSVNGRGGAFAARHEGGGKFICCAALPIKHTQDMTVTVRWTDEIGEYPQSRPVKVPPYTPEDGGHFAVHFLRNGDIKVFVTMHYDEHPAYPLTGEESKL